MCTRARIQPNEYGLTNPESKSSDQGTAIPMGTPDSRIGSERDQIRGRIAAVRIVDWSPYKNDRNPAIKYQMFGNPYGALIGFWVQILDSQSILVRLYVCGTHMHRRGAPFQCTGDAVLPYSPVSLLSVRYSRCAHISLLLVMLQKGPPGAHPALHQELGHHLPPARPERITPRTGRQITTPPL